MVIAIIISIHIHIVITAKVKLYSLIVFICTSEFKSCF